MFQAFLDSESQLALQNISDSIDCWMEFIRMDPMDLIDDQPYNSIIFNSTNSNDTLQKALQMTESLQQIAHPVSYTHLTLPTNREV